MMAKAPTKKAAPAKKKSNPLAAAKARVAKLEKVAAAKKLIEKGKSMLKATKRKPPVAKKKG